MTQAQKYHLLYRFWIKLRTLLALVIILAGLTVGLLSLLLPFESLYKERLEQFLETQWDLEVRFNEIKGSWQGYGPSFALKNLELTGTQSIQLASADLFINVYQLMIPGGRTGIDLNINGAELDMIHSVDGANITINNDQGEVRFSEMLDRILESGSLRVDEMIFNVADQNGNIILNGLEADFLLQQDENNRALQIKIDSGKKQEERSADQQITIKSRGLKSHSLTSDAQWYVQFDQFELNDLKYILSDYNLPVGQLDGEIWLTTVGGVIESITGNLSWLDSTHDFGFDVLLKQSTDPHVRDWQALLKVQNIHSKDQTIEGFEIMIQRSKNLSQIKSVEIPVVWVARLLNSLQLSPVVDEQKMTVVSGQFDQFVINYDEVANEFLGGELTFSDLSLDLEQFKFSNLAGLFEFTTGQGQLLLNSVDGELSAADIYRGAFNWTQLEAQMSLDWEGIPSIQLNSFWCDCQDFDLQVWFDIKVKENVHMIMNSRLSDVVVPNLHKYWPHKVWKEKTLNWLDQSLLSGVVEQGFVFVQGDMVKQGFKKGAAEFISRAYTRGIDNRFHPDWPVVEGIDAIALFDHDEVHVQLQKAHSLGFNISQAQVDIDSFASGIINVEVEASSQDNGILEYIRTSPLVSKFELDENIKIGGKQQVNIAFDVALKQPKKQVFQPQGQVIFQEGQFYTEHFALTGINGPVQLDGYQLLMEDLPAKLKTADVLLNGEITTQSDQGPVIDVDLSGLLKTDYLLDLIQQDLPISGESNWEIKIKNLRKGLMMVAKSALSGVTIDLPAPLNKMAEEHKNLEIICSIPCSNSTVEINYNNEIKSTLSGEAGEYHLTKLQFMEAMSVNSGTVTGDDLFGGDIEELDLDQWLKLLSTQSVDEPHDASAKVNDEKEWPVDEIKLKIKKLNFMSRAFGNIELEIKRMTGSYEINVNSEAIKGRVLIDDDLQSKGIVAEFDHLNWIEPVERLIEEMADEDAVSVKMPDIHLWANQFSYAGIPLGSIRMEMRNVADGIKIEQLSLKSDLAEINVSGSWNKFTTDLGYSSFNIVMISERIADFLQTVGFSAPITNAQTLIEMQAQWNGVPSQFNIANIDGSLDIKIGQGQVLDQKPGFGRVLGLFNLTNLPRRLILDFRDVLADGLLFSSMEGRFKIDSGVAKTEDFLIKASSVKIHIDGDVGFADQSYDQMITIRPQIGKTFPTIGAIAGGPVGAAAGFLVQGLLDKKLKSSNEIIYQVTGTWDNPVIELIDKTDAEKQENLQ